MPSSSFVLPSQRLIVYSNNIVGDKDVVVRLEKKSLLHGKSGVVFPDPYVHVVLYVVLFVVPFLFFCVVYRDMEGFSLFLGSLIYKIPFFFRRCAEVLGAGGRTADGGRWGIFRVTERRGFAKSASPESDKDEGIRHHCAYSG